MQTRLIVVTLAATLLCPSVGIPLAPSAQQASASSGGSGSALVVAPPTVQSATPLAFLPIACASSIRDQANPSSCLQASSVATQGLLFPYPGLNNFLGASNTFAGGGVGNQATGGSYAIGYTTVVAGDHNTASGDWASVVGGQQNTASGKYSFVGGGANNLATNGTGNGFSVIGGGSDNRALGSWSMIGGGQSNAATASFATVGGGNTNVVNRAEATIAGGNSNTASGIRATIGGGASNSAVGYSSTIAGGTANFAVGPYSSVAGGKNNLANFNSPGNGYAAVGGGRDNSASGAYATVGGGGGYFLGNIASGLAATVPGGRSNAAQGDFSFAAGRRAKANHAGSFVWADGQNLDRSSSASDEFNIYAGGGTRVFSDSAGTTGVLLAPGSGSWSSVSDRARKENVAPVSPMEVLARVATLPISTWNYTTQDDSIRHIGPMAQDFHAAFGVGSSDKTIDTIDPDGVALAAIQGLNLRLDLKDGEIAQLRETIATLEERLARFENLQGELEKALKAQTPESK